MSDKLIQDKETYRKNEIDLGRFYLQKIKMQREYFEYSDVSNRILEQQKIDDVAILTDKICEFNSNQKASPKLKKELSEMLFAVIRIDSYCINLETIAKASTVHYINQEEEIKVLSSKLRILDLEKTQMQNNYKRQIKSLEEEIKFITDTSK